MVVNEKTEPPAWRLSNLQSTRNKTHGKNKILLHLWTCIIFYPATILKPDLGGHVLVTWSALCSYNVDSLKTESCHDANFVFTGANDVGCHTINVKLAPGKLSVFIDAHRVYKQGLIWRFYQRLWTLYLQLMLGVKLIKVLSVNKELLQRRC